MIVSFLQRQQYAVQSQDFLDLSRFGILFELPQAQIPSFILFLSIITFSIGYLDFDDHVTL